jgi:hypothetical protein
MTCSFLPINQNLSQKNCGELRGHPGVSHSRNRWRVRLLSRAIHPVSTLLRNLTGSAPQSALGAEPPENEFAFAKNTLTEGARSGPGHVVPLDVLNVAAAVADEVVMPHAFRIESRGATLDGHFTQQTRLDQIP